MKRFLPIIFNCIALGLCAQPHLTIGETFDFQQGDVFGVHYNSYNNSQYFHYLLSTILQRTDYTDSVEYTVSEQYYTIDSYSPYYHFGGVSAVTRAYGRLGLPVDSYYLSKGILNEALYWNALSGFSTYNDSGCTALSTNFNFSHPKPDTVGYMSVFAYISYSRGYGVDHRGNGSYPMGSYASGNIEDLEYAKKGNDICGYLNIPDSLVSGIGQPTTLAFNLYPNPATNHLNIQTNNTSISEINIYNTTGSLVSQPNITQSNIIDISQLPNGIYVAEIRTKEGIVKKRWVKL